MRNLHQMDHLTKQFMSKHKQSYMTHTITQGLQKQTHKTHANMQEYKTQTYIRKRACNHTRVKRNKHTRLT